MICRGVYDDVIIMVCCLIATLSYITISMSLLNLVLKERSNTIYKPSGLSYALLTFHVCELLLCN